MDGGGCRGRVLHSTEYSSGGGGGGDGFFKGGNLIILEVL